MRACSSKRGRALVFKPQMQLILQHRFRSPRGKQYDTSIVRTPPFRYTNIECKKRAANIL